LTVTAVSSSVVALSGLATGAGDGNGQSSGADRTLVILDTVADQHLLGLAGGEIVEIAARIELDLAADDARAALAARGRGSGEGYR
jgi:hypothetical protein